MKYSDFIHNTLSGRNNICWNYYPSKMDTSQILEPQNAMRFIHEYFQAGGKSLPLLLSPTECEQHYDNLLTDTKNLSLSFHFDSVHQLPGDRASHTVSGFFLGLLLENCINGRNTLYVENSYDFPFSYVWFLTYLYHDFGYCIAERGDASTFVPNSVSLLDLHISNTNWPSNSERIPLSVTKKKLGINLSPFSQFGGFLGNPAPILTTPPYSARDILRNLTQSSNRITGSPKLAFSSGAIIRGHRYSSSTITRYFNYRIVDGKKIDHGILGGLLFYDRMIKNYMLAYLACLQKWQLEPAIQDFYYRDRHFCFDQLKVFSYISDCILSHNIWKQPSKMREKYGNFHLTALLEENFRKITYEENPLLYILVVADTLDPVKIYTQANHDLKIEEITNALDITYTPRSRLLHISSNASRIDIAIIYQKAVDLSQWTAVKCSPLENNQFTVFL